MFYFCLRFFSRSPSLWLVQIELTHTCTHTTHSNKFVMFHIVGTVCWLMINFRKLNYICIWKRASNRHNHWFIYEIIIHRKRIDKKNVQFYCKNACCWHHLIYVCCVALRCFTIRLMYVWYVCACGPIAHEVVSSDKTNAQTHTHNRTSMHT